ncbi:unnamed protein product, partial [Ranitomeya imitator]
MVLVGVFSREDESTYNWLVKVLVSSRSVNDVRCVTITNRFQNFQEETAKSAERVNVTDDEVDSLYDEELRLLCEVYGRNNVLVVIDDLESSSEEEKSRILSHQQSIGKFALDLFLFSSADKANLYGSGYQSSVSALRSLEEMKRIIKGAKHRASIPGGERWTDGHISVASGLHMNRRRMIVVIACAAITVIILVIVLSTSHQGGNITPHTTVAPARHVTILATTPYNHSSV